MILWSANIFQLGISVPSLLPSAAATFFFRERAAATSSRLCVSELIQTDAFGPLGSSHCPCCPCVSPQGNRWWHRMGAATGCGLDHSEDTKKKKKKLLHLFLFPYSPFILFLDLHLLFCDISKNLN